MQALAIIGGLLITFLVFLFLERICIFYNRKNLAQRICVTGSRGKSSTVRLLAAILRADGRKVLAKTTGSKASLITPSGNEQPVNRRGRPSFLEQKKILREGVNRGADTLIVETMSLKTENQFSETVQILDPAILAICESRLDHLDEMGETLDEVRESLAVNLPKDGTVFCLDHKFGEKYKDRIEELGSELVMVGAELPDAVQQSVQNLPHPEFKENIALAVAISRHLNVEFSTIDRGLAEVKPDYGSLKIWKVRPESSTTKAIFVNSFAANDPRSTREVLETVREKFNLSQREFIGLFNIRGDRGRRTRQWLEALNAGEFPEFNQLALIGDHSHSLAVKRKLALSPQTEVRILQENEAKGIMKDLAGAGDSSPLIFGFGNIAGPGARVVDYCREKGRELEDNVC